MVRNGVYMMRHVVYNPLEFSHPLTAFVLGLCNFLIYLGIETINIATNLQQVDAGVIIQRYVSYTLLL
jgi:hypothetical protein